MGIYLHRRGEVNPPGPFHPAFGPSPRPPRRGVVLPSLQDEPAGGHAPLSCSAGSNLGLPRRSSSCTSEDRRSDNGAGATRPARRPRGAAEAAHHAREDPKAGARAPTSTATAQRDGSGSRRSSLATSTSPGTRSDRVAPPGPHLQLPRCSSPCRLCRRGPTPARRVMSLTGR